jgi:hypothetical protein
MTPRVAIGGRSDHATLVFSACVDRHLPDVPEQLVEEDTTRLIEVATLRRVTGMRRVRS